MTVVRKRKEVCAGCSLPLLARVRLHDGNLITQATTSSITINIRDDDGLESMDDTALVISSVIFDTLQTDAERFPPLASEATAEQGYNFEYEPPVTAFPTAGKNYEVDVTITDSALRVQKLLWEVIAN